MAETSRHLTAFTTPLGLFQFRVMPFGLQGAPTTFQHLMEGVLQGVRDYAAAYIDDVVIHGFAWEEHLSQIRAVLGCLCKAGLTAKPQKCQFGMAKCVYLGHRVGGGTIEPDPCKIEAVREFPVPKTKKDVRQFLGLTVYYRKFIPGYSTIANPLNEATQKSAPNVAIWTEQCQEAFIRLKGLLCCPPVLRSPDFEREFILQTDASGGRGT